MTSSRELDPAVRLELYQLQDAQAKAREKQAEADAAYRDVRRRMRVLRASGVSYGEIAKFAGGYKATVRRSVKTP